jgi:hypothetical protein
MSMRTIIDSDEWDDRELERLRAIEKAARAYRDAWMDLDVGNVKDPKEEARAMVALFMSIGDKKKQGGEQCLTKP